MPRILKARVAVAAAAATLAGVVTFTAMGGTRDPASALAAAEAALPTTSPTVVVSTTNTVSPTPSVSASRSPNPRTTGVLRASDASLTAARPASRPPTRIRIPSLGAVLGIDPMGLDRDGAMALPESPSRAGWYRFGPTPGEGAGATVVAAHIDSRAEGAGPFAGLRTLDKGDVIEVVAGRTIRYRVTDVLRIDKGELDLDSVFSRTGPERLHVVSCGGPFNRVTRHYEDNIVVIAVPVGAGSP